MADKSPTKLIKRGIGGRGAHQCALDGSLHISKDGISSESWETLKCFQPIRRKHPRFYFDDGNVIFLALVQIPDTHPQVKSTLFRVHRYFFQRDSPIFRSMFSLPLQADQAPEGEDDDKPIKLEGMLAEDFAAFLSILYPEDFYKSELSTSHKWVAVLNVASFWDFASIRSLAIDKLVPLLSTAEKIAAGKQYEVDAWLLPGYMELCAREQPLHLKEGEILGMADVVEIYRIRSLIRYRAHLNRHIETIRSLVRSEFGL